MAKRGRPPKVQPVDDEPQEEKFEACGTPDERDNSTMRVKILGEAQLMTAAGCLMPNKYVEIPGWIARSLIKEGRAESAPYMGTPRTTPEAAVAPGAVGR